MKQAERKYIAYIFALEHRLGAEINSGFNKAVGEDLLVLDCTGGIPTSNGWHGVVVKLIDYADAVKYLDSFTDIHYFITTNTNEAHPRHTLVADSLGLTGQFDGQFRLTNILTILEDLA